MGFPLPRNDTRRCGNLRAGSATASATLDAASLSREMRCPRTSVMSKPPSGLGDHFSAAANQLFVGGEVLLEEDSHPRASVVGRVRAR